MDAAEIQGPGIDDERKDGQPFLDPEVGAGAQADCGAVQPFGHAVIAQEQSCKDEQAWSKRQQRRFPVAGQDKEKDGDEEVEKIVVDQSRDAPWQRGRLSVAAANTIPTAGTSFNLRKAALPPPGDTLRQEGQRRKFFLLTFLATCFYILCFRAGEGA